MTRTESLSSAQERIWFIEQIAPGNSAYVNAGATVLDGPLDYEALQESLDRVVRRHESLRSRFVSRDGAPRMLVDGAMRLPLRLVDRQASPGLAQEAAIANLVEDEVAAPFKLETGPLIRAILVRWGQDAHTLLFIKHHIITDGWSMDVLASDLAAYYNSATGTSDLEPAPLTIRYSDYVRTQREQGSSARDIDFWRNYLDGAPGLLLLPTDYRRPPRQSFHGRTEVLRLGRDLADGLRTFARTTNATLFMVLHAAVAAVMSRHAGMSDVVLGTPTAGRLEPRTESLVGLFVNTLPIRIQVRPEEPFRELVKRTRKACLAVFEHQAVPFEQIVQVLDVERQASHSPLVQVSCALHNVPRRELRMNGLQAVRQHVDVPGARMDLTAAFVEDASDLELRLQYNSDLFNEQSAQRIATRIRSFLQAAVLRPETPVTRLPTMDDEERRTIVSDFSGSTFRLTSMASNLKSPWEAVARQAEARPEHVAVRSGPDSLTYKQLMGQAEAIAAGLQGWGVTRGDVVGVCLERGVHLVPSMLAVFAIGAVYLPIDPSHPSGRRSAVIKDARCRLLLVDDETDRLEGWDGVSRELQKDLVAETGRLQSNSPVVGADLAYLMYTSGSTGTPKGVEVSRDNLVGFMRGMLTTVPMSSDDVMLAITSTTFDISLLELLVPLTVGAEVRIVGVGSANAPGVQEALLAQPSPTLVGGTPSTWAYLRRVGIVWPRGIKVLSGGETLPPSLAQELADEGVELWNLYGPTEATVYASAEQVHVPEEDATFLGRSERLSIGRPLPGSTFYVLDEAMDPVPIGVDGHLFIGGVQVASGYRNRPEETEHRFVRDPFAEPPARLYRTGDIARWSPDGRLELRGRSDDEMKVSGFRVDPSEIEAVLTMHPAVKQAVVCLQEDGTGGASLCAFVRLDELQAVNLNELRNFVAQHLPRQLVPRYVSVQSALPTNTNGKVNRKALPHIAMPAQLMAPGVERPTLLGVVQQAFCEALSLPQVDPDANFFALGGTSMLAVALATRLSHVFDAGDIPTLLLQLFDTPTPQELAVALAASADGTWHGKAT